MGYTLEFRVGTKDTKLKGLYHVSRTLSLKWSNF